MVIAERYSVCSYRSKIKIHQKWMVSWPEEVLVVERRAALADPQVIADVYPVVSGSPPTTRPSRPGTRFQVGPTVAQCDTGQLQAPDVGGLLVAMADGSVRTIRPSVTEPVFWGMMTPDGGEVADD